jgi:hypothetical protein
VLKIRKASGQIRTLACTALPTSASFLFVLFVFLFCFVFFVFERLYKNNYAFALQRVGPTSTPPPVLPRSLPRSLLRSLSSGNTISSAAVCTRNSTSTNSALSLLSTGALLVDKPALPQHRLANPLPALSQTSQLPTQSDLECNDGSFILVRLPHTIIENITTHGFPHLLDEALQL